MINLREPEPKKIKARKKNGGWVIYCPGCKFLHWFGPGWYFNGDVENPTFSPSLKVTIYGEKEPRCHFILTNGILHYCNDCQHELANKDIELPELPE